jgi:succinate dehydrogenase / fumarate reductase cytochrome b subunit
MLARVHSLLGVVPLGVFLIVHVYDNWPALRGREPWVDQALHTLPRSWAVALVLVPLGLHAVLGGLRLRRAPERPASGLRGLQALTGALVLAFVAYHVSQVWSVSTSPARTPRAVYAALWRALGRPLDLAVYLVGISAVCFHLAHGVPRAAHTLRPALSARALSTLRVLSAVLGLALWLSLLQLLGHFALGQPLVALGNP